MHRGSQLLEGHTPQIIACLPEQDRFDETGLTDDLRNRRIGAVIAADDPAAGRTEFSNWSTAFRAAAARHYEKLDNLGYLAVWLPREDRLDTKTLHQE